MATVDTVSSRASVSIKLLSLLDNGAEVASCRFASSSMNKLWESNKLGSVDAVIARTIGMRQLVVKTTGAGILMNSFSTGPPYGAKVAHDCRCLSSG